MPDEIDYNMNSRFRLNHPSEDRIGNVVDSNFASARGARRQMLMDQFSPHLYSQIYVTSLSARELCPDQLIKTIRRLEDPKFNVPRTDDHLMSLRANGRAYYTSSMPGDLENADQLLITNLEPYKEDNLPQRRLPEGMQHLRISGNFKLDSVCSGQVKSLMSAIHTHQIITDYVEWCEKGRRSKPEYTPTLCGVMGDPIVRKQQYNDCNLVFLPGRKEWPGTLSKIASASIATVNALAEKHGVNDACHTALSVPRCAHDDLIIAEQLIVRAAKLNNHQKTISIHLPSGLHGSFSDWVTRCVSDIEYWTKIENSDYSKHMDELLKFNKSNSP